MQHGVEQNNPNVGVSGERTMRYEKEGYLMIDRLFSEDECDALVDEAHKGVGGRYTNRLDLHRASKKFKELMLDPRILTVIDDIQHHRMIPIGSVFFYCKPNNELEQGSVWHQDNYAAKAPYGSYIVCGLALDDADQGNGSLIVFPESHRYGDLPSQPSKNFDFDDAGNITQAYPIGNSVEPPEKCSKQQLTYRKGSLIILHGHTVHGAYKNHSQTRWRHMFYMHYIKDGDPFWPGWNARRALIDRG